jgi:PAS domain S-box-containing protein
MDHQGFVQLDHLRHDVTHTLSDSWLAPRKASFRLFSDNVEVKAAIDSLIQSYKVNKENIQENEDLKVIRQHYHTVFDAYSDIIGFFILDRNGINLASNRDNNIGIQSKFYSKYTEQYQRAFDGEEIITPPEKTDIPLLDENEHLSLTKETMFYLLPIVDVNTTKINYLLSFRIDPTIRVYEILRQHSNIYSTGTLFSLQKGFWGYQDTFSHNAHSSLNYNTITLNELEKTINTIQSEAYPINSSPFTETRMSTPLSSLQKISKLLSKEYLVSVQYSAADDIGLLITTSRKQYLNLFYNTRNLLYLLTIIILIVFLFSFHIFFIRITDKFRTNLIEYEENLLNHLNSANSPLLIVDKIGKILSVNSEASKLFGYSVDQMTHINLDSLVKAQMTSKHDTKQNLLSYLTDSTITATDPEFIGIQKGNSCIFLKIMFKLPLHLTYVDKAMAIILEDITLVKKTQRTFKLIENELNIRNEEHDRLLNRINHEFRTPLTVIRGNAEILLSTELRESQKNLVNSMLATTVDFESLIDKVTYYNTINALKISALHPVNLNHVIHKLLHKMKNAIAVREITVINNLRSDNVMTVRGELTLITEALEEIIQNSVYYNRFRGTIVIDALLTDNGFVRVSITDTGIGISSKFNHRVFVAFDCLEEVPRKQKRLGLGLYAAKRMVESVHGRLGFESKEREGSTFWCEFLSHPL